MLDKVILVLIIIIWVDIGFRKMLCQKLASIRANISIDTVKTFDSRFNAWFEW